MIKESDILAMLVSRTSPEKGDVIEGVQAQDDAAVLRIRPGFDLCVTTDFVRGTGFRLFQTGHLNLRSVGYYVVAANVSDLAAMGSEPLGFLSVLRYRPERSKDDIMQILDGIDMACKDFKCQLVGGDSGTYEADVLSGTAIGIVEAGRQLSRSTMSSGQAVFVTGDIGRPAAALAAVTRGPDLVRKSQLDRALQKWIKPEPRIAMGRALVASGLAISCMDVSDGLAASLQQLSRIAKVGFIIDEERLPLDPAVDAIAAALHMEKAELGCGPSVDFELLFSAPIDQTEIVMDIAARCQTHVTQIGVTTADQLIRMRRPDGQFRRAFPGKPWDHQVRDIGDLFKPDA
ncbi:thiamine-phosphate kinase [Mesorhizobium sp. CA14]|uniref:thiamine-phosphate kinase n=1 Tax=Mesorhizobium sp. CA14 TaxID=2876642 RepID=UPI001CCF3090|nr:thiamine-phosphate kinase [Mesorhizobium sp. CA14]MBZ9850285.1 thiamine-phosphate kinase [Mesorhizobium sp. CA14]